MMKLRIRISVRDTILYPSLLNPVMIVMLIVILLYSITCTWIKVGRVDGYYVYSIDKESFKEVFCRELIVGICAVAVNTYRMNNEAMFCYKKYLEYKWFPKGGKAVYRKYAESEYKGYLSRINKRKNGNDS